MYLPRLTHPIHVDDSQQYAPWHLLLGMITLLLYFASQFYFYSGQTEKLYIFVVLRLAMVAIVDDSYTRELHVI